MLTVKILASARLNIQHTLGYSKINRASVLLKTSDIGVKTK